MASIQTQESTLADFLDRPETQPACEYIDGQIVQKPMPQGKHSTLQLDLGSELNRILKPNRIARAYTELRCTFGERSIVPDLSVFTWDRIPRDPMGRVAQVFTQAPDWTIEILSPDQNQTKVIRNILHCLDHGSQMGWLIDPEEEILFVYDPDHRVIVIESLEEPIPTPTFADDLELTLERLWSWLEV